MQPLCEPPISTPDHRFAGVAVEMRPPDHVERGRTRRRLLLRIAGGGGWLIGRSRAVVSVFARGVRCVQRPALAFARLPGPVTLEGVEAIEDK